MQKSNSTLLSLILAASLHGSPDPVHAEDIPASKQGQPAGISRLEPAGFQSTALKIIPPVSGNFEESAAPDSLRLCDSGTRTDTTDTTIKIAHDANHLFITFRAGEDGVAPLPAAKDGNGWYFIAPNKRARPRPESNSFSIEIRPDANDNDRVATLLLNVSGEHLFAFYEGSERTRIPEWGAAIQSAVSLSGGGWSGSVAIPWSELGLTNNSIRELRMNFVRFRSGAARQSWVRAPEDWSKYHQVTRDHEIMGTVRFPKD